MSWIDNIHVVIGIDFGTTHTGFSFSHVEDEDIGDIETNDTWPGGMGNLRTNTVLQYKNDFEEVESWGYPALCKKPNRRNKETKPIELFKLYLGNCLEKLRPKLPEKVTYKRAITDYLCEVGKLIKETIPRHWPRIDFMQQVLLVVTIQTDYSEFDKAIMRECIFNAGLIADKYSENLVFITEPEATAIYCMNIIKQHALTEPGTTFMIVDCSNDTVDLTTRKLLEENQLGEVTERAGDFCGSTFIDKKFIELLESKVGKLAINSLNENYYGQLQYIVQEFCQNVKIEFTGDDPDFCYEMDFEDITPVLLEYVTGSEKDLMEEKEWIIELDFNTIKSMFDSIVDRIIEMIRVQLDNSTGKCSAISLVGNFSQSKYLQKRIKEEFNSLVENISIPTSPIAAVSCGATIYGKSLYESKNLKNMNNLNCVIATRVLNYTFGIKISPLWEDENPPDRITSDGRIHKFHCIVERKTVVTFDQEFLVENIIPTLSDQTKLIFEIFYTREHIAVYCDEPGMKLLGKLIIHIPNVQLGTHRPYTFSLAFDDMKIKASVFNQTNRQNYRIKFFNNYY
ncbi:hypothetical protein C1645_862964 [Glomus cerebriforme]|uniref:Actin-like ATPase domain-containing protein n=1 Tax=Glomus cerebriforme TaxID=658196 RepID=A0A397SDA1_9GLOM|nr:hypothetical protein C1645_862964 [Glomus cerebriforme]